MIGPIILTGEDVRLLRFIAVNTGVDFDDETNVGTAVVKMLGNMACRLRYLEHFHHIKHAASEIGIIGASEMKEGDECTQERLR